MRRKDDLKLFAAGVEAQSIRLPTCQNPGSDADLEDGFA